MIGARLHILARVMLALPFALSCDAQPEAREIPSATESLPAAAEVASGATGITREGLYRVTLRPRDGEVPLHQIHAWIIDVATRAGQAFRPSRLAFSGAMPQHQHGFVTEPRVTRALAVGTFLIEGVKFHMPGDWTLRVELVGPSGPDVATLHVQVGP